MRRFPEGEGPVTVERQVCEPALSGDDERDIKLYGKILFQDFRNIPYVQKGLHSGAFPGAAGEVQEGTVRNFHRAIDVYLSRSYA